MWLQTIYLLTIIYFFIIHLNFTSVDNNTLPMSDGKSSTPIQKYSIHTVYIYI